MTFPSAARLALMCLHSSSRWPLALEARRRSEPARSTRCSLDDLNMGSNPPDPPPSSPFAPPLPSAHPRESKHRPSKHRPTPQPLERPNA
eukprot:scaffold15227_cov90-Isochrysis_galbana.AAC.2